MNNTEYRLRKIINEHLKEILQKHDLLGKTFYHGTTLETWKNSEHEDYLFLVDEMEVAKQHAIDRAESTNPLTTAIVVLVEITPEIVNLVWDVDDDLGNWSRSPFNYKEWQDSYNAVGSFVIQGKYDIHRFPIVWKQSF